MTWRPSVPGRHNPPAGNRAPHPPCEIGAGSFFEPLPPGADACILAGDLHDWADVHAPQILCRCAEAADTTDQSALLLS
jgi:hypothetical protein